MSEDTRTTLKRLVWDALDEKDQQRLLCDPRVEEYMHFQWDETTDRVNPAVGNHMWERVIARTMMTNGVRRFWVYKITAIAISILLLLGVGNVVYWSHTKEDQHICVMASGVRCIESASLLDSITVRMGPDSQLICPKSFDDKTRDVELEGQAFFDVARDWEKPFTIHTRSVDVTASGTAFEVFNYDSEGKLETILLNGKVKTSLEGPNMKNRREVTLSPSETLAFSKQMSTVRVKTVNTEGYSDWHNGVFSFRNERLNMILTHLGPWSERKVKCLKEVAKKYRFTFKVRDEFLEWVLSILNNTSPIKYGEKDNEYELYIEGGKWVSNVKF